MNYSSAGHHVTVTKAEALALTDVARLTLLQTLAAAVRALPDAQLVEVAAPWIAETFTAAARATTSAAGVADTTATRTREDPPAKKRRGGGARA
jgi:hypothetical protein